MSPARLLVAVLGVLAALPAAGGPPAEHGRVVLSNFTNRAKVPPVQFDHWRHRSRYTCRLCHVDVGFAMSLGETRVSAKTNKAGYHCGACHDGKTVRGVRKIFAACGDRDGSELAPRCKRCHDRGDPARRRDDFEEFAEGLPRSPVTGDVDWEAAEAAGLVNPVDELPGVSIPRKPIKMDKDVTLTSMGWMSDVIFSHKKHAVWNGCEVCHPDIYPNQKDAVRKRMIEIRAGQSCGVCHGKVAFALGDCARCHAGRTR